MVDVFSQQQFQVYSHWKYRPGCMIHGDPGAIFVHMVSSEVVVELQYFSYGSSPFFELTRTRTPGIDSQCSTFCYIPRPQRLLVVYAASQEVLRAFSVDDDRMIWTRKCRINGLRFEPKKFLICSQGENILVYDGLSKNLVILDPLNSSHIQIISLPVGFEWLHDLQWGKDDLLLLYTDDTSETSGGEYKITKLEVTSAPYFTIATAERPSSSSQLEPTAPPEAGLESTEPPSEHPPLEQPPSCPSPPRLPSAPPLADSPAPSLEVPPPTYWSLSPEQFGIAVSVHFLLVFFQG